MSTTRRRKGREIQGTAAFLLAVCKGNFFVKLNDRGEPLSVPIPSVAAHLSYEEADALCQQIKARGYNGAVVCDVYGRMVDAAMLAQIAGEDAERARKFWGE
jgi:hypothetical protein